MRRRTLWQAGAACLVSFPALARDVTRTPAAATLVWHAGAVAVRGGDGTVLPLPEPPSAPPAAVPAGTWHATRDGALQRWAWQPDTTAGWQQQLAVRLPEPAHALAALASGELLAAHGTRLTLLDAQGAVLRRYEGTDLAGRRQGTAAALAALPHRRSLLAAWPALREWWEISLDPAAPPVFDGYVHDHRMGEAIARPGYLGIRRIPFDAPAPVPAFVPAGWPWVACADGAVVRIVHLDVRREVARLTLDASSLQASVVHDGAWWMAQPGGLRAFDPRRWSPVGDRPAPGPAPVDALAVGDGELHALSGGTVWRWHGQAWKAVAHGVAAMASGDAGPVLTAPAPWQGVAALRA